VRPPLITDVKFSRYVGPMKSYWLVVLALGLLDAALITSLLVKDGGPANLVWWAFLIIPLAITALVVVGLILHAAR
jgi:hypothetical protein